MATRRNARRASSTPYSVYQLSLASTWPRSREHRFSIISQRESSLPPSPALPLTGRAKRVDEYFRYIYRSSLRVSHYTRVSKIPNPLDKSRQFRARARVCTPTARSTPIFLNIYHDRIERGQRFARRFTSVHAHGAVSRRAPEDRVCLEKFPKTVSPEESDPATHFQISSSFKRIRILMQFTLQLRFLKRDNSYRGKKRKSVVTVFGLEV